MTEDELIDFSEELKVKFQELYDKGVLEPLMKVIYAKFNDTPIRGEAFDVYVYGVRIIKHDTKKMIPLCFFGPSQNLEGKYSGVHFGIATKLPEDTELKLEAIKKEEL